MSSTTSRPWRGTVPRSTKRESRAVAAGWAPPRDLSPEGRQFTATHPALYLHLYCNFSGVHLVAHVDHLDSAGRIQRTEIAKATWRPTEVSERLVVEWAQRALTAWLERSLVPQQEP